jgi:hypothetical protein
MLDVLMYLPRSVLSQSQLELFLWLLKVNNVDNVPSVKSMQELNAMLQKLCGIDCIAYDGALGHKYYVNGLSQIIGRLRHSRTRLLKPPAGLCSFAPEHCHDCYITFPGPPERKEKKPHAISLRTKKPHAALRNLSNSTGKHSLCISYGSREFLLWLR